jgi:predicted HTH transcriptional regulator
MAKSEKDMSMTTEQLEILLEAGAETQSLDYKASCPWDKNSFVKDFLAMANVRYGGHIVIGVDEEV